MAVGFETAEGIINIRSEGQWRTQEFISGGGSTNSVEDRENGVLGAAAL